MESRHYVSDAPTLMVVGGPIRWCLAKLIAEPPRKRARGGKTEQIGDLNYLAVAVGEIFLGELNTHRIKDRCEALTLGDQVALKGPPMHPEVLGDLI